MADGGQPYPNLNLLFRISIDAVTLADFSECGGLSLELATEDYVEGGENRFTYKLPLRGQPPNLVLKRGVTAGTELWDWFITIMDQEHVELRSGEIALLASPAETKPTRVWSFTKGYPVKWTGPELNALSPAIAFETIEIAHQGIRIRE